MITLTWLYAVLGLMFAAVAALSAMDRANPKRLGNAAFWGLLAVSMLAGDVIGDVGNGALVLGLAALAGFGAIGRAEPPTTDEAARIAWSEQLGGRLFLAALIIPATALLGTLAYTYTPLGSVGIFESKRETYFFLALGVAAALSVLLVWLRPTVTAPLQETRRLLDAIGWAAVLPQMLAALGVVFAMAGVGTVIGDATRALIPGGSVFLTVLVFALGMALFTMVMGNAFAAFPVMAAAIGVPLLVRTYGGDAAIVGAVGMLAGFCGTLMTPMAANFNIVPAALLSLSNRNAVIRAQVGTALPLLAVNIVILWWFAFP